MGGSKQQPVSFGGALTSRKYWSVGFRRSGGALRPRGRVLGAGAAGAWASPERPTGPVLSPDAASRGRAGLALPARAELRGRVCGPSVPSAHRWGPDSSPVHSCRLMASLSLALLWSAVRWSSCPTGSTYPDKHINDWRVRP